MNAANSVRLPVRGSVRFGAGCRAFGGTEHAAGVGAEVHIAVGAVAVGEPSTGCAGLGRVIFAHAGYECGPNLAACSTS